MSAAKPLSTTVPPTSSPSSASPPSSSHSTIETFPARSTPAATSEKSPPSITTTPPTTVTVIQTADTSSQPVYTLTPFIRPPIVLLPDRQLSLDWAVRVTVSDGSGTGSDVRRDHPVCTWVNSQLLNCQGKFYNDAGQAWKDSGIPVSKTGQQLTRVESKTGQRLTWDPDTSEWLTWDIKTCELLKAEHENEGRRLEGPARYASYLESFQSSLKTLHGQEQKFTDNSSGTSRTYRIKWNSENSLGTAIAPITNHDGGTVLTRRSTKVKSSKPNDHTPTYNPSKLNDGTSTWGSAQCWGGMVVW